MAADRGTIEAPPLFRVVGGVYRRQGGVAQTFELRLPELSIARGRIVAIIGASGTGKSTLLNLLSGLEGLTEGRVEMALEPGAAPVAVTPENFPHDRVGRVFQHGHLIQSATVAANLALSLQARGQEISRARLAASLARVSLAEQILDRRVWQLSGGEQQRVAVARAMLGGPSLIFADEPTSSLDPDLSDELLRDLCAWGRDGTRERSILWVTHNYDQVIAYADEVLILEGEQSESGRRAGLRDGDTRPRPVTEDAAALHRLVSPLPVAHPPAAAAGEARAAGWPGLAMSVALGLMLSRGAAAERRGAALAPLLSLTPAHRSRELAGAAVASFSELSLLLRLVTAMLLFLAIGLGFLVQRERVGAVLHDPKVCSTRIAGAPHTEQNLLAANLLELAGRPWLPGTPERVARAENAREPDNRNLLELLSNVQPVADCDTASGAWPRRDIGMRLWLPGEGVNCRDKAAARNAVAFDANVIAMHPNEPVLSSYALIGEPMRDVGAAFRGRTQANERLGIVLSRSFVEDRLNATPDALARAGRVCLAGTAFAEAVEYLGASGDLPMEDRYFFDAVVPLDAFEKRLGIRPTQQYETAVLYFDPHGVAALESYLRPVAEDGRRLAARYIFDPDALKRLSETISASITMRTLFVFVGLLTLAATAFMVFASTSALIAANARPLAMQLALGMPRRFLSRLLWLHSLVLWGAATALAGLLATLIWFAVAAGAPATAALRTLGPGFYWGTFAVAAGLILLTSWLSTKYSFVRWLRGARSRLSRILQSGS